MNKAGEISLLARFVDNLPPDSYLQDIFTGGVQAQIEQSIENDLGFTTLRNLQAEANALRLEHKLLSGAVEQAKAKLKELQGTLRWLEVKWQEQLDNARHIASKAEYFRDCIAITKENLEQGK